VESSQIKLQRLAQAVDLDAKLNEMILIPSAPIFKERLQALGVEELQEMLDNDQYLDDFLEEQPEINHMQDDADKVRHQTFKYANDNLDQFQVISQLMESHHQTTEQYKQKAEELQVLLAKCKTINQTKNIAAVCKLIKHTKTELFKEADGLKKQF